MYTPISDHIYHLGFNERGLKNFENLWPIPLGVDYNAYLIVDEKVALIDSNGQETETGLKQHILDTLHDKPIDYLIVNHMEPDHSHGIGALIKEYPDMTVVGNKKTIDMLHGFYDIVCDTHIIEDGDEIILGKHTLQFFITPMLHWPETMMTYEKLTQTLFSGDAFGCYGALNGNAIDRNIDTTPYWSEMRRYYATIVGKYGVPVQAALKKLSGLPVQRICSTHGPIWEEHMQEVMQLYDRFSRYDADKGVVIAYGSMYGNNTLAAEFLANELSALGIRDIVMYDLNATDISYILSDLFKFNTLIIGSSVYNGSLLPIVKTLMLAIESRGIKDRIYGCFGTYAWSVAPLKELKELGDQMKWEQPHSVVTQQYTLNPQSKADLKALAAAIANKMNE